MLMIFFLMMIMLMVVSLVMIITMILSFKLKLNREKSSPFECGFDSNSSTRLPFSLRFFLITIIFLIFDVEIVILLPALKTVFFEKTVWWLTFSAFLFILIGGLFYEWQQGALKWAL